MKSELNSQEFFKVQESWDDNDIPNNTNTNKSGGFGFSLKFFLFSFFVFLLAIGFTAYSFYSNSSVFSKDKIDFFINAPVSLDSGNEAELDFSITNKNTIAISDAYIMVTYNSGENSSGDKNLISQKIELGEVLPNTSVNKSLSVSLFGNEGDIKEIDSNLFYKVTASKTEFNRSGTPISVLIKSSPVSISIDSLKEVHQDNDFNFTINLLNNTKNDIKNLLISVRSPNDFIFSSSSIPTYNDNPSWIIPNLKANQKQAIIFSGKLTGSLGQTDKFSFYAGTTKNSNNKESTSTLNNFDNYNLTLDNIYSKTERSITIAGQYLHVAINYDSTSETNTVSPGDLISLEFVYNSELDFPLDNLVFMAKLSNGIDVNSIDAGLGSFDPDNNVVVWDKSVMPDLAQVPAKGTGKLRLKFKINKEAITGDKIGIQIFAKGDRASETGVSSEQNLSLDKAWIVN